MAHLVSHPASDAEFQLPPTGVVVESPKTLNHACQFPSPSEIAPTVRKDRIFLGVLFAAALVGHFYLATINWRWGFLIGHEFRQTQTAIIAQYIEIEHNFSLRYSTPILGKPWEFPLEFPLYEWSVVLLSKATGRPHFESARTLSLASFYLTLPAIYILLGQAGLSRIRRLLPLSLILATPVYLFYARAFLMDTMALMASAWFLAAFVQTLKTRKIGWLMVSAIAGSVGGLVKSLTFFVWLWPAALFGAWCVWKDWRRGLQWRARLATIAWGLGAVAVPGVLVNWWVRFTDAIKVTHASAYIFTSESLTHGNFGMYDWATRYSISTWKSLLECWSLGMSNPWSLVAIVAGGMTLFRRERWRIFIAATLFLSAQMMFPLAYAYQDYYFTACAVFAATAVGFALNGILDSPLSTPVRWTLLLVPFVLQFSAYRNSYFEMQSYQSNGGTGLTIALRDYLPKNAIVVVAGNDWAAMIPYYSHHKALMIRNGLEHDHIYLERAFRELSDENVGALVLVSRERTNQELVSLAAAKFDLATTPTFSYTNADVYVNRMYAPAVATRVRTEPTPEGITPGTVRDTPFDPKAPPKKISHATALALFSEFQPAPDRCRMRFGYSIWQIDGAPVLGAHPDCDLWIPAPAGAREIEWEFGINPEAYEGTHKTNGVEFIVDRQSAGGQTTRIFQRTLNPVQSAKDRGLQKERIPVSIMPGDELVFRTRPNIDYAFDWSYWKRIDVH